MSLTDDPAHVSGPIKLPDGITRQIASERLEELGAVVSGSLETDSAAEARRILSAVFGPQLDDMRESERQGLHSALDARDGIAVATLVGSPRTHKPRRSYGV